MAVKRAIFKLANPPDHKALPYLRLWGGAKTFEVWLVDGKFVRDRLDTDFTNVDQGYHRPYIPKNEIWIDSAMDEPEIPILVRHGLKAAQIMQRGGSYDKAATTSKRDDAADRRATEPKNLRLKLSHMGGNGKLNVFLVNGRGVRDDYDPDYTLGGHSRVYGYVPNREIWIDDEASSKDRPFNFLHELFEYNRMGAGQTYEKAHKGAIGFELEARRNPARFGALLASQERLAGGSLGLDRVPEFRQLMM